MNVCKVIWVTILALFCALLPLTGQESRSTLLGRVTDPTNSVIIGARVEATNTATGVRATTQTGASGDYALPFLIPGPYTIAVESPGFKRYTRSGIELRVADRTSIDVTLEVGTAAQTVEVTGESPLLDTSTASMGQVIDSRTILDMPMKDGMVLMMATLAPGIVYSSFGAGYVRPFDTGAPSGLAISGAPAKSNEFSMDGTSITQRNEIAYSPPAGVVEEFKVQTSTFDASFGFQSGGTISTSLKSGTNSFHGQAYYFMQNPILNANTFFNNKQGVDRINLRAHRWGGMLSGPVYLPKLYDGRNKTFWMYGYEQMRSFDPTPYTVGAVPTPEQRQGDFSALLALGSKYQIYDPYSGVAAAGGRVSRQPLLNNVIPPSQIRPVASNIVRLYDLPNQAGTADGQNIYRKPKNALDGYFNHIYRIDHSLSEKWRFWLRMNFTANWRPEDEMHNRAVGDTYYRWNRGYAMDHVYILSPNLILNLRYSLTRYIVSYMPMQLGWDLAGAGFSSDFIGQINQSGNGISLPRIQITDYLTLAPATHNRRHNNIHEVPVSFTASHRSHTLRSGVTLRAYRENTWEYGREAGTYSFGTNWTRGPLDTSGSSPMGQGMASFLYGLPTSGEFLMNPSYAEQATNLGLYFQDDWKVNTKLTVSLGLRYELHYPLTERYNRSVKDFDFAAASPIEAQVMQKYAQNPIPEIPVGQFQVKGGLTFAGVGGSSRYLWDLNNKTNFMPRIGIAYSITPKTVLRTGVGVFYEPLGVVNLHVNQAGFTGQTTMVPSPDNGLSFIADFANPFPGGLIYPQGAAAGLSTNLGTGISFFEQALRNPYMQRWQFALQRQFLRNLVLEASYVGNRGTRQRINRDYNSIPSQYLSTLPVRDQATINSLGAQVTNPFYPLLPGTDLASATISRSQLLKPYPQFTSVSGNQNQGYSWYHSMQVRAERRFSAGASASLSYTWAKLMDGTSYLNATDPMPYEQISSGDRTHRLTLMFLYELPFGRNKPWGGNANKALSQVIGGWQLQGIYSAQGGAPLSWGNIIFTGDSNAIGIPNSERTIERWFNVDAGFERDSRKQLASNIRTWPGYFSGLRQDGQNNWDLSAIKNTQIREGVRLQFRAEAINALNHPQFGAPNRTPTSSAFGQVTSEWSWPRLVQFSLKLVF